MATERFTGYGGEEYTVETSEGTGGQGLGFSAETSELTYENLSKLMDASGNVTDMEGMQNLLWHKYPDMIREWRGVSDADYVKHRDNAKIYARAMQQHPSARGELTFHYKTSYDKMVEINEKINEGVKMFVKKMPKAGIKSTEIAQRQSERATALSGLQKKLGTERFKGMEQQAVSGVYGLGGDQLGGGFGGADYSDIYGQIGEAQEEFTDIYGLGKEKEEEFAEFASDYYTTLSSSTAR